MKLYHLKRQQQFRQSSDELFAFFSRPENLAAMTPSPLRFRLITPPPVVMKESAVIDYTIRVSGIPLRWTTLITAFEPNRRFVDLQLRGPYAYWHHTHSFTETDDGTMMTDEVRYALPFGILGTIAHRLFVRRQLETIFEFRKATLEKVFTNAAGPGLIAAAARSANRRLIRTPRRKKTS
jgi:ligand-binding SRPBCC domain-containing protein